MVTAIEYPYALFLAPTVYTGGPFFGFTTTFAGRTEPLFGEHAGSGGYYDEPQYTGISDCWTAALQVSYYDRLESYERLDFAEKRAFEEQSGLYGEFRGVAYAPPPPQRKPEVAAIWTRDYESEPEGATPETTIDYSAAPPKFRRPGRSSAKVRGAGSARQGVEAGAAGAPGVSPAGDPARVGAGAKAKAKVKTRAKAKVHRQVRRRRTRHGDRRRG
jgi:hypothetical protein